MAGRKPKPTALKLIQGNPGKRPINKNEPQPAKRRMKAPAYLSVEAKKEWRYMATKLFKMGLLTEIDRAALAGYCQAYGRWVEAENILNEKGPLYKTENGCILQSPMLCVANRAMDQMYKFLTEFGMSPSSRSRVVVRKEKMENSLDDFLNQHIN